jgi:hypothetical protein
MHRWTVALLILVACKDKEPEVPPPASSGDGVTVIFAGVAPRQLLRYQLTPGTKATSEMICDVDLRTDGKPGPMPTMVVNLETAVEDIASDGSAKLRMTVLGVTVRDRSGSAVTAEMVQGQAEALRGVAITETLGASGTVSDSRIDATALSDHARAQLDTLSRNLAQVAMQLPQQPVGPGARWRLHKALPDGGIRAVADTTYTLTSLSGSSIGYTSTGTATGDAQIVEQEGAKVRVTDTHGHFEGAGSVELSRYAPAITSSSTFSTTLTMLAPDGGPGGAPSQIEIITGIRLTSSNPEPAAPGSAATHDGSGQGAQRAP